MLFLPPCNIVLGLFRAALTGSRILESSLQVLHSEQLSGDSDLCSLQKASPKVSNSSNGPDGTAQQGTAPAHQTPGRKESRGWGAGGEG